MPLQNRCGLFLQSLAILWHPRTKNAMRLMREHGLTVRPRRRFVATTDSDHDGPIFPNLAKDVVPTGANQLWVADITYIAIAAGFVYLAAIFTPGRDASSAMPSAAASMALRAAIASRQPPIGCIHHSDRGSQYASEDYRKELEANGLKGSIGRRGNPTTTPRPRAPAVLVATVEGLLPSRPISN